MTELFLEILNRAIAAGWLVPAVLLLRLMLKKSPRWTHVLLWGLVGLRLVWPFSLESGLSLIPSTQTLGPGIMMDGTPEITTGMHSLDAVVNPWITESFAPSPFASANPLQILLPVAANLWLLGILILLLHGAVSYFLLRRKVATAVRLRDNIFQSEHVASPFVLGFFMPRIYLPFGLEGERQRHVIAHEVAHIRRKDHWWKLLGYALVTAFWFHPLLWLAYVLLCRDIELACDEKVIMKLDAQGRGDYSQALLDCSLGRWGASACPLAFGEVGVKDRIKSILHYRKPKKWHMILALVLCAIAAVCFLTDPAPSIRNPWVRDYIIGGDGILGTVDKEVFESVSQDFAIGADRYGRAVFRDPHKAFATFRELYAQGLELIREENGLAPISNQNFQLYKTFGWQVTSGTEEAQAQARFVTRFLDIYENSFDKYVPMPNTERPTTEELPG